LLPGLFVEGKSQIRPGNQAAEKTCLLEKAPGEASMIKKNKALSAHSLTGLFI